MDGLILIVWVVAAIVLIVKYRKDKKEKVPAPVPQPTVGLDLSNQEIAALVDEAITVVNDFLEAGRGIKLFCDINDDFNGLIVYCGAFRNRNNWGYHIKLCSASSPDKLREKIVRKKADLGTHPNADCGGWYERIQMTERFLDKYEGCYRAESKHDFGYTYDTRCVIPVSNRGGTQAELTRILQGEIKKRCPLADLYLDGNPLYTKGVSFY